MAKSHFFDLGGTSFEGRTKTEAKERAMEAAAASFTGDYFPRILAYRGYTLVLSRVPRGWAYQVLEPGSFPDGKTIKVCPSSYSNETRFEDVFTSAKTHLAQMTWRHEDGIHVPDFVTDPNERRDHESWCRFQLRYQYFKEQGFDGNTCHRMACERSLYEAPGID